jgi:aspartokinase/homoserine dehydrogenase 1
LSNLLVMKFGGTSMGSAERIRAAASLCAEQNRVRPVAAVVSAMSKVTDLLLDTLRHAEAGDGDGVEQRLEQLRQRHATTARELLSGEILARTLSKLEETLGEFDRIARGMLMLGERPPRSVDEAVAVGERLSSELIAAYLQSQGTDAFAVNARDIIVTDSVFGNASPLMDQTRERASAVLKPALAAGRMPVMTASTGRRLTGARRHSDGADRIFRPPFSRPCWTRRNCGSGRTSMAS